MNQELKKINKTLLFSWLTIIAILLSAYAVEVIKGERSLQYIMLFATTMLIPIFITYLIYLKKKDWEYLGYIVVTGYMFMYAFVMFTGATQMVSSYILPLLCFLILYHKPWLVMYAFAITFSVNVASLFYQLSQNSITVSNSKDVEIRFAVIVVAFAGGYVSAKLYDHIYELNQQYTKELAEKNREIQEMAIQTIATIANTIDAKDEYTKGHSKRVSEYSVAIAREIGLDEPKIKELRSIALLHDIGKIGVPDSVLNKPGRLTDSEYELMKQHTVTGSEILKDIGMLPGIDIGAKYHHERYDGKGYPEKLTGDEIPEIARIIAVADAFDAMTSNRVYRKHLEMDHVMEELERCKGSQFDPQVADALIKLLTERKLVPLSAESSEEDTDLSDVTKIWSRVIEKGEEKFKDKTMVDELTGLFGRSYGEKMIREAVESQAGTLLVLDVDHFRRINSEAGFLLGDIFLKAVAVCLGNMDGNKVVARYGGDEFVAFLPGLTDKAEIEKRLKEFQNQIRQQKEQMKEKVSLTVSIGVRICDNIKNVYQDKFLDADRALYISKRNGGDCYTFYEKSFGEHKQNISDNVDLLKLQDTIKNPEKYDTYIAESPEFYRAYELLKRLLAESEQPIQLILFTAKPNEGINVALDTQNQVMEYLEKAIARSIKGRDFTFRYSSTQRMILLSEAGEEGASVVSAHIMKEFYKLYDSKEINVSYGMIGIM